MKILLLVLPILWLCCACQENKEVNRLFTEADELMNTNPDSALAMLDGIEADVTTCPCSQRMQYALLRAKAQNKAYVDFTTDSVMLEVTGYYDRHGTPNKRMMAHYLLGCAYRDLKEAPRTLECYKDALACADTLSDDCDYRTMMSICGQLAHLYDKQAMPKEEIETHEKTGRYALLCKDTLSYITSIELQAPAYSLLGDTAKVFERTKTAYGLYLSNGYIEQAAKSLPTAINIYIQYKEYDEAKRLMDIFESKSGCFDDNGVIMPRKSFYYNLKGLYYLGISRLDSAQFYFQKLYQGGYAYDAIKGLIKVYTESDNSDSLRKYIGIFENIQDQYITKLTNDNVRQVEAMYDYTRHQQIAHEESLQREYREEQLMVLGFIFIVTFTVLIYLYRESIEKKKQLIKKMTDEYLGFFIKYNSKQRELDLFQKSHSEFELHKKNELDDLNQQIEEYKAKFEKMDNVEKKKALLLSSIVNEFKEILKGNTRLQITPSEDQWERLQDSLKQTVFYVYDRFFVSGLTEKELRVAILVYLDFKGEEIGVFTNSSAQSITNTKRNINKKVFGVNDSKSLKSNLNTL